jgi:hypothetical protein
LISDDVFAFLTGGKSLVIGTCDKDLVPECARAVALWVAPDRKNVNVFLPEVVCARTLENLRANGCIAIGVSHPPDHRSLQLKGSLRQIAPATPDELLFVQSYLQELSLSLDLVGLPANVIERLNYRPCLRADVALEAIFLQTPGPDAGRALTGTMLP